MKTALVLSVAVLANSLGSVCLSKGMKDFGAQEALGAVWLPKAALHVVSDPWMILGIALLLVFLASYMAALSWSDLSFVFPATAPAYILTALFSKLFLNEMISPTRWLGTLLIVMGTGLVTRTYSASPAPVGSHDTAALAEDLAKHSAEPE